MNRRMFIRNATATLTVLYLTACGKSATAIAGFITVIANYGAQLATYFGATSIATQITTLATTISTDVTNWVSSGSQTAAQAAIQALNDLMGLLNQIPITAQYSVLIDLLIGAAEGLLALLPTTAAANVATVRLKRPVAPMAIPDYS